MQVHQTVARQPADLASRLAAERTFPANLVLVFGAVDHFLAPGLTETLGSAFPGAILIGCSTAGEITAGGVEDGSCSVTALHFGRTSLAQATTRLSGMADSFAAGTRIGEQLAAPDLKAVLVFGPGLQINGSALVDGISSSIGSAVPITGGLAGDGGNFQRTFTLGAAGVADDMAVAVGLYGEHLRFGHGSFGGWEPFGPARRVTRCAGNILYELDGEPALAIYKRYLGEQARGLPASGLLFPLAMLGEDHNAIGLIRTILGVDEATGSLTLAGEIDPDGYVKLMHASTEKLVSGAEAAAEAVTAMLGSPEDGMAILVSCVGRKLVMGGRVDEEIEAVGDVLSKRTVLTGFYSYGEISPFLPGTSCKLHNQTMTITYLGED